MNLNPDQQILIKDIFNVTVDENNAGGAYVLTQFPNEISKLGQNVSLIEHNTYFDSLLMERLQVAGTEVLAYLEDCLNKCHYVIEKPWNQNQVAQKFINYSIEIIKNFIFLVLQEPEIFSEQLQIDTEAAKVNDKMLNISMRLMTHFQRRGFNLELIQIIYPKIQDEVEGKFPQVFFEVLIARQRFQTILQSKAYFYLNLLLDLIMIPNFKTQFFHLSKTPFLPAQMLKIKGSMIDSQSPFGLFARISVLGINPGFYHQQKQIMANYEERMIVEFGHQKLVKQKLKYYADLQFQFYDKLTEIYKVLLKKDTQKQFFEWNYALIFGNLKKAKLGSRLQGSTNAELSHDGIVLNVYMVLLNLCKPFLSIETGKYKNIDPQYFIFKQRALMCKYDTINQKDRKLQKMQVQKQFGTITQFFFMCLEFLNIGYVALQDNFVELNQYKQKLEKEIKKIPQTHPLFKKITYEVSHTQSKMIRYFVTLMDDRVILSTVKLLDLVLHLIPEWINVDFSNLRHGKIKGYKVPEIAMFLPQHLLENIYKFHLTNFKFKPNYLNLIGQNHIHQILNLTCLLLAEDEISSNPYMAGNFVQLLFFFLHETKTGIMHSIFRENKVAHQNLTNGLIRFYCDIAVTGSSHQFYSKFKYRFYVNKIFTSLWTHEVYRQNLKAYFHLPVFQKFLNMVMTDTTYCFDQTNQSYGKYKDLEDKKQQGALSQEDQKQQQQLSMTMSATLDQSTSNLKLMRELSAWSPDTFLSEAQISTVVPLLNCILKTFVDPTTFVANRQLLSKFKFEKQQVLSDLIRIYANMDINQKLSSEIVRDGRFYNKQYFSKALQKASNEHYTGIDTLQKFQALIVKIALAVNQEVDEEIYGQIPDKYLCALMSTLMKDPVLLPNSGNIVDRVNIHRSLLIDERDPFTRSPLVYSQVIEQKQLKDQIDNWKKKRMEELKKGDKELKYGNIEGLKKQKDEQERIFNDNFLEFKEEDD